MFKSEKMKNEIEETLTKIRKRKEDEIKKKKRNCLLHTKLGLYVYRIGYV